MCDVSGNQIVHKGTWGTMNEQAHIRNELQRLIKLVWTEGPTKWHGSESCRGFVNLLGKALNDDDLEDVAS